MFYWQYQCTEDLGHLKPHHVWMDDNSHHSWPITTPQCSERGCNLEHGHGGGHRSHGTRQTRVENKLDASSPVLEQELYTTGQFTLRHEKRDTWHAICEKCEFEVALGTTRYRGLNCYEASSVVVFFEQIDEHLRAHAPAVQVCGDCKVGALCCKHRARRG